MLLKNMTLYTNLEVVEGMTRMDIMDKYNLSSNFTFDLDKDIIKIYIFKRPEDLDKEIRRRIEKGQVFWMPIEVRYKEAMREYKLNQLVNE